MTARLRELPADRLLTMQEVGLMYLVLLPSSCALDAVNPACVPDRVLFVPGAKYRRGLLAPQHAWPWSGRPWVSASLRSGRQRLRPSHAHDGAGRAFCELDLSHPTVPDVRNDFSWAVGGQVRRYVERKERL